jgi:hypothetical protein
MNGDVGGAQICDATGNCASGCPPGSVEVEVEYQSTNPRRPSTGTALVCVVDNGEGAKAPAKDTGLIMVSTGPFAGDSNSGEVQGNIQSHTCTCVDNVDNNGNGLIDADDPTCQDPTGVYDPNRDEG